MSVVILIIVFFVGMYLSVRIIAALYGFIDLWYTIRTAYAGVVCRVVFWGGMAGGLFYLLMGTYESAFLYGLLSFTLAHFMIFLVNKYAIARPDRGTFHS